MMKFLFSIVLIGGLFFVPQLHSQALAKYFVLGFQGKVDIDGSKPEKNNPLRVGTIVKIPNEAGYLDFNYLGSIVRMTLGEMTVIESNAKKISPEKILLQRGKQYLFIDKRLGKNRFHMATPHFIVGIDGKALKETTKAYLVVQSGKSMIYVLKGELDVTIARINKKYAIELKAGDYLEYDGSNTDPKPGALNRPSKDRLLESVFETMPIQ